MMVYAVKFSIALVVLLCCYHLLFRKDKRFAFRRFFLLFGLIGALCLPLMDFDLGVESAVITGADWLEELEHPSGAMPLVTEASEVQEKPEQAGPGMFGLIGWIAFGGSLLFFFGFLWQLAGIVQRIRKARIIRFPRYRLVIHAGNTGIHSFFGMIFIGREEYETKGIDPDILAHERAHIRRFHSLDNVLVELVRILFWWNPLIWLYRRAMHANHEFEADMIASRDSDGPEAYGQKILAAVLAAKSGALGSAFGPSLVKQRILMLNNNDMKKTNFKGRLALAILAIAATFGILSCRTGEMPGIPSGTGDFTVLLDPGHGAHDHGAVNEASGKTEKELTLALAEGIAKHAQGTGIKVLSTRQEDVAIPLKERVAESRAQAPDLFISLHVNDSKNASMKGLEVYYSDASAMAEQSQSISKILADRIDIGRRNVKGKVGTANFMVLRQDHCPALILELGFLSNKEDRAILNSAEGRDGLAQQVVAALATVRDELAKGS